MMIAPENPILSVVVAIVSDTTGRAEVNHLEPCLSALTAQTCASSIEIIVPYHPSVDGIARLRCQYPNVRFLEVADLETYNGRSGSREHHDELRARGLAIARGELVALIEDHGIAEPDWGTQFIEAHRAPFAAIGGAIENGIDRPLNWAVYFCDFLRYQNPLPRGESAIVSDANFACKRAALESIRPVWQEIFHEASVTSALRSRGQKLALDPSVVVRQHRQGLRMGAALKERFVWGRSYAAARTKMAGSRKRVFWAVFALALPGLLMARMSLMAVQKRRTIAAFVKAWPLTLLLTIGWACGEFTGYATARAVP